MHMERTFRERNLTRIAIGTIITLALLIVGSFQLSNLPLISGPTYTAVFSEAGGLKPGDPVEISGVTVGKVKATTLHGATVEVAFTAKNVHLGADTSAQIKTGTLLGARYLAVTPAGSGSLSAATIPLTRTTAPYNLSDSLSQIASHTRKLNLNSIAQAMSTFSQTFRDTSGDLRPAFDGITALSRSVSSRDAELRTLFRRAAAVTGTFRERSAQITTLVTDGNLILGELQARRLVISRLIRSARGLAVVVSKIVTDNSRDMNPALTQLNKLLALLNKNQDNIVVAIRRASSFITGLGEGVAHGPWFTGHLDLGVGPLGMPYGGIADDLGGKK